MRQNNRSIFNCGQLGPYLSSAWLSKIVLAIAVIFIYSSACAQAKELTYANQLSAQHPVNVALKAYFSRVAKSTDGDLTFNMFPGGQMGGGEALLGMVRDGLVDASFVNGPYAPSDLPLESILGQLLNPNPLVLAATQNEMFLLHCPECREELKRNNVVPVMYYATAAYYLMCTKPISTLAEAKGVKVRSSGAFGRLAASIGMTPVNMTGDETYQAMQRHQVSCVFGSPDWLKSYSLQDVVKDITNLPMDAFGGLMQLGVNKGSWNSLSGKDKAAMEKHVVRTIADIEFAYIEGGRKAINEAQKINDVRLVHADPDLRKQIAQFNQAAAKSAIAKGRDKGIKNMPHLVNKYMKVMRKWEKIVSKIGNDKKAYEKALRKQIFSKLN